VAVAIGGGGVGVGGGGGGVLNIPVLRPPGGNGRVDGGPGDSVAAELVPRSPLACEV
jgi:hypothetical protein